MRGLVEGAISPISSDRGGRLAACLGSEPQLAPGLARVSSQRDGQGHIPRTDFD